MKLPKAVLDVVRGAGGAAVALAIGCSSSGGGIHQEPAAQLRPVATPPTVSAPIVAATPPPAVTPPPVVATPPHAATLEALPPSPVVADAGTEVVGVGARPRHRHRSAQQPTDPDQTGLGEIGIGGSGHFGVNPACGRG